MRVLYDILAVIGAFSIIFLGICALVIAGERDPGKSPTQDEWE